MCPIFLLPSDSLEPRPAERQIGSCNELEKLINTERRRYGYEELKCDLNMRWVANKHVENQLEEGYTGFEVELQFRGNFRLTTCFDVLQDVRNSEGNKCNLHSWFGKYACCYTSDHKNPECVWSKPLVGEHSCKDGLSIRN